MNEENVVYIHNVRLLSHKNKILPFAYGPRGIMLSKISQKDLVKKTYYMIRYFYMIYFPYMCNLRKTNEQTEIDSPIELVSARGRGVGGWVK